MSETIRLGILRLSDAAPVIVADEQGFFTYQNLTVQIIVENSWQGIADKIGFGLIDGAIMPAPLALACAAGLTGRKTDIIVPMATSSNGCAITMAKGLQDEFNSLGIRGLAARRKLHFGSVHAYSMHDLLLRYWLAANGVDPDQDVEIHHYSPSEMIGSLAAGALDGFAAGPPWGQVAAHSGLGFIARKTSEIWQNHPEKCLALRADFAAGDPARVRSLVTALRDACATCAKPTRREALATVLSRHEFVDLPPAIIATSLDPANGGPIFNQNYPIPAHANWAAMQLLRWDKAPDSIVGAAASLYRPDIYIASGGVKPVIEEEVFCDSAA
jgi:NitT/TauT family transport system ATP-binding protein/nitrate/nitrite transport system substrate-binding protein